MHSAFAVVRLLRKREKHIGCKADGDVGSAMRKDGYFVQHARSLQQAGAKHQWGLQDFDLLVCVWDSVNFVPMLAASRSSRKVE